MDIKCKNCGQMIDENDKYCKYCGYLIPQKEKEEPLSKKMLDDKVQEMKATISEEDISVAEKWDLANLSIKKVGDKKSLYTRNVVLTIVALIVAIGCLVGGFLMKSLVGNDTVAFVCLMLFMFAMLSAMGITIERYYNTKALKSIEENSITVRKYGFKKPAEFLMGGFVFEVVVDCPCPQCEGEIIGDLHIERIERNPVVVCNINRKHCWVIDEKQLIADFKDGKINIIEKKKTSK